MVLCTTEDSKTPPKMLDPTNKSNKLVEYKIKKKLVVFKVGMNTRQYGDGSWLTYEKLWGLHLRSEIKHCIQKSTTM